VSSSGHLALVPQLLGWSYADLPADLRKTFEVALHAGSAPALLIAARRGAAPTGLPMLAVTLLPAAVAGLAFERPVEERLGGMRSVALAQVLAGAALVIADRSPERRSEPDALDYLAVGLAQAAALVPGVSRSGAAMTAGRLRGLSRPAAAALSLRAALPVTVGAGALKGARMLANPPPRAIRAPIAVGFGAAIVSALGSLPLLGLLGRRHFVSGVACYRILLGSGALAVWHKR
jgi:undecaprenyl-diphosphatase